MSFGGNNSNSGPKGADPGEGRSHVVALPTLTIKYGFAGNTEPNWSLHTTVGSTFVDSAGITWKVHKARKVVGAVTAVYNSRVSFVDSNRDEPANVFKYGVLEWLTGYNAGIKMEVRAFETHDEPRFQLLEAMPYPIEVGDQYTVNKGCGRTRTACKTFNNIRNHRGFPDMPTEEKALATPDYQQQGKPKEEDDSSS